LGGRAGHGGASLPGPLRAGGPARGPQPEPRARAREPIAGRGRGGDPGAGDEGGGMTCWRYYPYVLTLHSPLLTPVLDGDPNSALSARYVPGSLLRGVAARKLG